MAVTEARLNEIRDRERWATPGPWAALPDDTPHRCVGIVSESVRDEFDNDAGRAIVVTDGGVYPPRLTDAEFIAHARADVPDLVAEVERLRSVLAEAQQTIDALSRA